MGGAWKREGAWPAEGEFDRSFLNHSRAEEQLQRRSPDGRVQVDFSLEPPVFLRMKAALVVMVTLWLHHAGFSSAQACPSTRELLDSLWQLDKMLAAHEASYRQSLRSLKKMIGALHNRTTAASQAAASCPRANHPAHGRRLGRLFAVGHQVHFLCKSGYQLIGPRSRVCLPTLKWSGQQPTCRRLNSTRASAVPLTLAPPSSLTPPSSLAPPSSLTPPSSLAPPSSLTPPSSVAPPSSLVPPSSVAPPFSLAPPSIRPSRCTHLRGSTRCTCPVGFTISGRDNNLCTDVDECRVFPLGRPGRLCVHGCANSPGSFRCFCPSGYGLARDGSSCTDVDECEKRSHTCGGEQLCVNTFGGFQCVTVACPNRENATYIKTSPVRCEKNPCMQGDQGCLQAPTSISFHFLSVVSNMSTPRVLFRVSAARVLGDTLRFALAGGRDHSRFSVQRSGRQTGTLLLVTPIRGPATLEAEVEMSELERHALLGRYLTKVTLFVSAFDF